MRLRAVPYQVARIAGVPVGMSPLFLIVTLALGVSAVLVAKAVPSEDVLHQTAAGATVDAVVSAAVVINFAALAINLLPFRVLDGGHLLLAARLWRRRRGR
jgi:Zn-dependent protease